MVQPNIFVVASLVALSGCADKLLSNDRIKDSTAMALNVPASSIVISDRRYDGLENTFYTASTPRAIYHCRIDGGNAMDFGMTNPPQCLRR